MVTCHWPNPIFTDSDTSLVPVGHDQELADAKEEELHEPREEVAQPGDGVLPGPGGVGPSVGSDWTNQES